MRIGIAATFALIVGSSALANEAAVQRGPTAAVVLEEIIVSARRREESLQAVPIAVTAISGDELSRNSLFTISDVAQVAPSMTVGPTGGRKTVPGFTIRGQRDSVAGITNDPAVGIYFAEAVQTRPTGLGKSLFDLASIQILKGPQGTLFGRNTTGGAILIQPSAPTLDRREGYADVIIGDYDRIDVQGAINLPIGSTVAIRAAGSRTRRDGYARNLTLGRDLDGDKGEAGRLSVLYEPNERFRNTLWLDAADTDQPGNPMKLIAVRPGSTADTRWGMLATLEDAQATQGFYDVEGNVEAWSRMKTRGATNVTTYDMGRVTVKNIINYRSMDQYEIMDYDGTDQPVLVVEEYQNADQFSNELQFLGKALSDKLDWIAGLYYFKEDGDRGTFNASSGNPANPRYSDAENTAKSIFAQADYHISQKWTATLGARYTADERSLNQRLYNPTETTCLLCAKDSDNWSAPTWTVGLAYKLDERSMAYIVNRRGYRAGGYNSTAISVGQLTPFDEEVVTDIEIGWKSDFSVGDASVRANAAVYYSDYTDIQRAVTVEIDGSPVRSIFNAAEATVKGAELELTVLPTPSLELSAAFTYTDATYDKFTDPVSGSDLSGNQFPYTPERSYRIAARYQPPFVPSDAGDLYLSASYFWQSEVEFGDATFPFGSQDSYGLLGLRAELDRIAGRAFSASVFVDNAGGEDYFVYASNFWSSTGYVPAVTGNPRTWGLQLSYKF